MSHTSTVSLSLPAASSLLSGETATHPTPFVWVNEFTCFCLATSHSRTVLSRLPLTRVRPFEKNFTDRTGARWPARTAICCPEARSHSLTVLSNHPAEARVLPSGEN